MTDRLVPSSTSEDLPKTLKEAAEDSQPTQNGAEVKNQQSSSSASKISSRKEPIKVSNHTQTCIVRKKKKQVHSSALKTSSRTVAETARDSEQGENGAVRKNHPVGLHSSVSESSSRIKAAKGSEPTQSGGAEMKLVHSSTSKTSSRTLMESTEDSKHRRTRTAMEKQLVHGSTSPTCSPTTLTEITEDSEHPQQHRTALENQLVLVGLVHKSTSECSSTTLTQATENSESTENSTAAKKPPVRVTSSALKRLRGELKYTYDGTKLTDSGTVLKTQLVQTRSSDSSVGTLVCLEAAAEDVNPTPTVRKEDLNRLNVEASRWRSRTRHLFTMLAFTKKDVGKVSSREKGSRRSPPLQPQLTVNGWAPRHIFDYNSSKRCHHCRKKSQFHADVYNMVTSRYDFVCAACCIRDYSPASHFLLGSLEYLSNTGLDGVCRGLRVIPRGRTVFDTVSRSLRRGSNPKQPSGLEVEYIFSLQPTPHLLRLVDIFRWFFAFSPFETYGPVVEVSVAALKQLRRPPKVESEYHMYLVAGSWAPRFHSGISLFVKDQFETKAVKKKSSGVVPGT